MRIIDLLNRMPDVNEMAPPTTKGDRTMPELTFIIHIILICVFGIVCRWLIEKYL